ncbi:MAG TPA: hypothetical protein P5232_03875 [Candidatus Moranbacteria bacterium]|nr:hypothetical protein [Candidatus Moranbacteria bacterium]
MKVPRKDVVGSVANRNFRFDIMGIDKSSGKIERFSFSSERIVALQCNNCSSEDFIRISILNFLQDFGLQIVSSETIKEIWMDRYEIFVYKHFLISNSPVSLKDITE